MLDQSLLDRFPLRGQRYGTDALGENSEEGNWVFNVLEVVGDLDPSAEVAPFFQAVESLLKTVAKNPWVIAC